MSKHTIAAVLVGFLAIAVAVGFTIAMATVGPEDPTVAYNPSWETTMPHADPDLPLQDQELNGTWMVDSENGATLTAIVENRMIEITMDNDGASVLYWVGTFVDSAENGEIIVSVKVDVPKPVMSQSTEKQFIIGDGKMTFELSAMGKTRTLELQRV